LHCLGLILNYRGDPRLRESKILSPAWVTTGIYRILNSEKARSKNGEIAVSDLASILDPGVYPEQMHLFLLGIMRKFELCFRFPEPHDDIYLIPELLEKSQPDLPSELHSNSCLSFRYTYSVWPEGLLPRFIVRSHALSVGQPRWRTGVVVKFERNLALVRADALERAISIHVTGPSPFRAQLLAVIRADLERIHADLPKLAPIASVPIPEEPSITVPYQELCVLEANGIKSVPRVVGDRVVQVDVQRLLTSVELPRAQTSGAVRIFISYSHKDEEFRAELDTHLKIFQRLGLIETWHDRQISAGDDWASEISQNLDQSDIVLLLISADFLASNYCYETEMKRALLREFEGQARVVPIILRDCPWNYSPFGRLQALPKDAKPVRLWEDRDSAWRSVADGIHAILGDFQARRYV
jgi:internalin A